jgi:transposase
MKEPTMIGVDLAKNVFQLHGVAADGSVVFRKKLSRPQFARFMAEQPPCLVAMEACASAHHWAREMARNGHGVRLIAPHYVKPFLKRQKNDAADAEAIVEAALRPTMRFVEPKTADQQARAVAFRTREQLVEQRTEAVNALRSHLYEFGYVAPTGIGFVPRLAKVVEDPDTDMPELARDICRMLLEQIGHLTERLKYLKASIEAMSDEAEMPRRLRTMPGVGPITALAVETFAPPMDHFRRGRDFAAWLGLVPRQHSTGGKQRLGKTSKMGQRDIRRLLITGAMAVIRWATRRGAPKGSWLARMLECKPIPVVAVALANKMARGIWAMLTRDEDYRGPVLIGARSGGGRTTEPPSCEEGMIRMGT